MKPNALAAAILAISLSACGGGGGGSQPVTVVEPAQPVADGDGNTDASGGISGSGQRSMGVITGFGSIFVNGVEYETDQADIFIDGQPATEDDLGVGMVAFVDGEINEDGVTGTAFVVIVDDEIEGPISAITDTTDADSKQLTILGVDVIVERTATVFENTSFETLAVGDVVEVSGFPETGNNLRATRVEKKSTFVEGETNIEIKGVVSGLTADSFTLGDYTVDYAAADLTDVDGDLSDGMAVEVYGTLAGSVITATRVETESQLNEQIDDGDEVEVEGTIATFTDISSFVVNGVTVDASGATFKPADLQLAQGLVVEVEGSWDGTTLIASEVELRRGRVEVEATLSAIDVETGELVLNTGTSSVTVFVTSNTLLDDDDQSGDRLRLSDLNVGDFLEVEAYQDGDQLIATRIDRDNDELADDVEIQGPVEAFTPGVDVTVLGTTYDVTGAYFEDQNDNTLTLEMFFDQLQVGDLIKIEVNSNSPTTAIDVELEDSERLDGANEFDDDDDSDDSDDSSDDSDDEADDSSDDSDDEADDSSDDSDDGADDSSDDSDDGVDDSSDDSDDGADDSSDDSDDGADDSSDDSDDGADDSSDDSDDGVDDSSDDSDDDADDSSDDSDDGSDDSGDDS